METCKILLHACCAPCSGAIVEALLREGADFAIFYSNDNIVPEPEYALRLREVLRYAAAMGVPEIEDRYDHATTLASSRWKDLDQVNRAGEAACAPYDDVTWWPRNWRKGGLQERRNEIIREQHFYNQRYCGCEFSEDADQRAAEKAEEGSVDLPLPRKSNALPR